MKYSFRCCLGSSLAFAMLSMTFFNAHAQGFADDFAANTFSPGFRVYTSYLASPETVATADDSGLLLSIVHGDPSGGENASYEINAVDPSNSISSTGQFMGHDQVPANCVLRLSAYFSIKL